MPTTTCQHCRYAHEVGCGKLVCSNEFAVLRGMARNPKDPRTSTPTGPEFGCIRWEPITAPNISRYAKTPKK